MTNPFQFGGVVSGDAFCNREKEQADLLRAMENAEKMFVFSERRYGKTSLVRAVLRRLPKKRHVCAYVDLWPTDGEATFVTAVAKAITESFRAGLSRTLMIVVTDGNAPTFLASASVDLLIPFFGSA